MHKHYDVVMRLDVDQSDHSQILKLGVRYPQGSLRWVAEWLCGEHVSEKSLDEIAQFSEDSFVNLVRRTVGTYELLF